MQKRNLGKLAKMMNSLPSSYEDPEPSVVWREVPPIHITVTPNDPDSPMMNATADVISMICRYGMHDVLFSMIGRLGCDDLEELKLQFPEVK